MKYMILVSMLILFAAGAYATGGAYIDDLQITSNSRVVFLDQFTDPTFDGWTSLRDISFTCDNSRQSNCCMYLNKRGMQAAVAFTAPKFDCKGLVEMTARVYLTPPEQQYLWRVEHKKCVLLIGVYSDIISSYVRLAVDLTPEDRLAKVGIWDRESEGPVGKPALKSGVWANLMLQLDPWAQTMTAFLDGKPQASIPYDPKKWRSIRQVSVCCSYGDMGKPQK